MSAGFTPGPWSVTTCSQGESCWCLIISIAGREDSDKLEDCVIASGAVSKRDANLIAAAPELYEALERLTKSYNSGDPKWLLARTALRKARGETL